MKMHHFLYTAIVAVVVLAVVYRVTALRTLVTGA